MRLCQGCGDSFKSEELSKEDSDGFEYHRKCWEYEELSRDLEEEYENSLLEEDRS